MEIPRAVTVYDFYCTVIVGKKCDNNFIRAPVQMVCFKGKIKSNK